MAKPNLKKIERDAYQNALNERFQLGKRYAEQSRENAMDLAQSISPGGSMTALNKGDVASFDRKTRRIAEIQEAQAIDFYRGTGMYNTPEYAYNKGLAHMSESAYLTNEAKRLAAQLLESEKKDAEWENGGRQGWYDFTTRQSSIKNKLAEMDAQGRNYYDLDALEEADLLWFDSVVNGNERWKPNYSNAADVERYNALVDQWASVDDWENFDLAKHLGVTAPEQYVSKTSEIQGNLNTVSGELERRQGLDALKADIRSNPNYATLSVYGGHEHVEGTLADRYDFDHYYDQQYFMNNPVLPEGFSSRTSQDLIDHYIQFGYDYLTPEELADYNALINAGRPEDAKKYLDLLSSELLARRGNVLNAEREVRAEHLGYGALDSAKTLIENPIGSAMTIAGGLFGIDDPNHPIYDTTRGVNTTREVYGQTLGEIAPSAKLFDQNLLTMGYNVLMSVGDMAVAKGIGGGLAKAAGKGTNFAKNAMQFVMSSESAASTIMNDLERGWDVEHSMLHGLTNGLIEAWTERGFMDSLFSEGGTFLSRVLKSGMAEGLEEVESGSLQIVSDALFAKMGENESEVEEVYNAFAQTMTRGEAAKMTLMYYANQLAADGLSGFATGGLMQAGTNVAENTWSTNVGKQVQNEGDLEGVLRIAEANEETTEAAGAAKRIREKQAKGVKVTARDMGELVTAVGNTIGEKNAAEITGVLDESITGRLEELGEDAENAKKLAPVIRNMYQGKKITSAERAGVEWTENAEQVVKEMASTQKESAEVVPGAIEGEENQRTGKKWLTEAGGKIQAAQREGLMESMRFNEALTKKTSTTTAVGKAREKARNTIKGKPKMAARDFAYDTGAAAGRGTFERARKENGRFMVVMKAEDGKTVEADVDSIRNAGDEGLLTILDYAQDGARHDMSEAEVNLLAATYAEQGGDVDATIQQFEDSYLAGYSGIANMTSGMDPQLASIAYEQGRAEAAKDEAQRIEEAKKIRANANPVTGWIGEVKSDDDVHGTGDAKALDGEYQNMTDGEQMVVDLGKKLSRNTGLNVVYYRSKANAAGKYTTMNGSYDVRSHTIYLDVNAGNMSAADTARQRESGTLGYAIMRTMGHEVTHAIETTSTEFYAKYKQAVKTELAEKGQDWAQLVRKKLDNAVAGGQKMTYAEAEAEVVADASEYMLQDSKFVNDLDAGLKGKVKRVIQDFMKKVRAAFRQIISGGHEEARALLDGMGHYSKRLQDLWDAGFMEMAGKEVQADFADERGANIKKSERDIDEYASVTEEDFHKNGRIYDYDFLVKQKPISVVVIPSVNTLMGSGSFKRAEIVEQGKNKIPGEENALGHKQVKNVYTGRTLSITNNSIRHGLNGDKTRILANAQIGLMIGDVVKNGIPINGLSTTDRNAIQTYAMVTPCVTEDGKAMMAVTHVDIQKNEVNSVTFTDLVHSANGRIYKKSEPGSYPIDVQGLSLHHPSRFTISISDLLEDVNMSFKSLLSDDVLDRLGEKRPDKGLYTGKVLYSRRENQTETEEFKNWFSGSKIVNDDGTPKIMYHGTPYGGFEEFKDWQYFTENKDYADKYHNPSASSIRGRYNPATQPMTYEVYLSVKKPFDTRNPDIRKIWREEFYGNYSRTPLSEKGLPDWTDGIDLIDFIEENGYDYDGIILDEGAVGGYGDEVQSRGVSVVARDSTQVKSATDNVGTFDPQNPNIKYSRRENVEETDAFKRWFLDSKVVNNDGTPRVVYHGTGTGGFTVFDKERVGKGNDQYGAGFYFASNKEDAEHYGNSIYDVYLSIQNPIKINRTNHDGGDLYDVNVTLAQAAKILELHPKIMDSEESPLGDYVEEYWERGPQPWMIREMAKNFRTLGDLEGDWSAFRSYPNEFHEAVRKIIGYDGVEVSFEGNEDKFYVAWFPEQIKSATDNVGTFDPQNPDIKYSRRDTEYMNAVENGDMEQAQKLVDEAAEEALKESKLRTENGKLRKVYHGTNSTDFNVFDPDYIGASSGDDGFFGRGFYFAYTAGEASYYGRKRIITAYLDMKNPFDFQTELGMYKGNMASTGYAPDAVRILNLAEKFPEIAKKIRMTVEYPEDDGDKKITAIEFAEAYKNVIENHVFEYQDAKDDWGNKETLVLADPEYHEYEYKGEIRRFKDYGFQKRFYGDANPLDVAYEYLVSKVYSYIDMPRFTRLILDNNREFTQELKNRGYDGVIQSKDGDEAVVFESSQIKSADPLTYDDEGNVIPLSERFNSTSLDIRYSRREEQPDSVSIREYLGSMKPTERMTETEKLLLKRYQENLKTLEEKEQLVSEQEAILAAGATGEEKMKAINRRNIYRNQANRASKALLDAERSDGFARVMATSQEVVNRYLLGSAGTVADAADLLDSEIAGLNNQLKAVEADISKAAAGQRAAFARGLFDQKQLNAAATTLKNNYGSRMSAKSIADRLALAYGELYADSSAEGAKRFASAARDLAEDILRRSKFRYKSDVLDLLANEVGVISLTETDEQEIRNAGMTLSQYKKAIAPYIKVADSGSDLASYASNAEYFGQGALASILGDNTEGNLAMRLYEIISREKAMESEVAYEGMSEGQLIAETMADIAATNLPMSTNNKTIEYLRKEMLTYAGESAEAAKRIEDAMTKAKVASARASNVWRAAVQEVNTAKAAVEYYRKLEEQRRLTELKEQKQEITDQLKSEYAKKLEEKVQKQREEYREREKKAREYRYSRDELNKIRRRIGRNIKRLNTLRMRETDAKHVPQELQHVADLVMQTFTDSSLSRLAFSAEKTASLARRYRLLQEVQSDETYYWDDEIETEIENLQALSEAYTAIRERSAGVPSYYSLEGVQLENEILQGVDNIVSNVLQMIDGRNDAFLRSRNETFEAYATKTGEEILAKDDYKLLKGVWGKWQTAADEMLRTGNMTPIYFMEHLNSPMVKAVFDEVREGQSYYAKIIAEGKDFVQNAKDKYHYGAWAEDGKLKMKTGQGHVIELTREEAAEIYAIAKREKNNKLYQTEHLLYGGFQYKHLENKLGEDGKTVVKNTPNQLDAADIDKISRWLTDEQKAYADELVGFLSSTMANYGNQASMNMFGYKKFTESYYIPFHTAAEQRFQRGDEGPQGENAGTGRVKNSGFTKKLQNGANATLMVGGLTETVSEHIHKMATYAAMVEPIENMKRLMNHKVVEADGTTNTIRALIGQKYGQASQNYMTQLLKDLNGAAQGDERATDLVNKMIGAFKRGAVMASASVVLQQPTAMARAMAMISPRYFAQNPLYRPSKGTWDEMMKYAGTAVIKDMGKFDVGMGLTASQYIADEHLTVMEAYSRMKNEGKWQAGKAGYKRFMDWLTAAPGKADQWTWGLIWKAVKAEQAAKNPGMDVNSEEFLQMCGERFDDVIDHTQVYDSVITRSNLMRSKNAFHKMATSFMSEPTLSINMLYDAVTGEHSGKKRAMIIGSVMVSQVLAGALAALAQAWNDDEDKRNWMERYVDKASGNILDNINPLSMIPYVSDLMSMFEGYEVERPDMAAIGDLLNYGMNFIKKAADPEVKLGWKDYENFVGTLANMLGLPAKNISREIRRTRNLIVNSRWTTPDAFNVGQTVLENIPFYEDKNAAYYERIVAAELRGDTKKAEDYREYMLLSKMVNEEALQKGLKKAMQAEFIAGNADEDMAIDYLMKIGAYTEETDAYWEVDKWEYMRETGDKAEGYRKYADFFTAVETGTNLKATIQEYLNNGVSKTTLATQITNNYKSKMIDLKKAGKGYADLQARLLTAYEALGYDRAKKLKDIQKWLEKTE